MHYASGENRADTLSEFRAMLENRLRSLKRVHYQLSWIRSVDLSVLSCLEVQIVSLGLGWPSGPPTGRHHTRRSSRRITLLGKAISLFVVLTIGVSIEPPVGA